MRSDRVLPAALVFSTVVHLGVFLLWDGKPEGFSKAGPKRMVVRLLAGKSESVRPQAEAEPAAPPVEKPLRTVSSAPRAVHAGAGGGGGVLSSRPLPVRSEQGSTARAGKAGVAAAAAPAASRYALSAALPGPQGMNRGRPSPPADPLAEIRRLIDTRKSYPGLARRRGWEGDVVVELQLDGVGAVKDVRVVERSGFGVLDRATVTAVRSAGPFPALPGKVRVPISYRLEEE